jgi:hypothetical protein
VTRVRPGRTLRGQLHGTREALRSWGVLTEIRRLLAFSLALMVLILTGADGRRGIATESEPAGR